MVTADCSIFLFFIVTIISSVFVVGSVFVCSVVCRCLIAFSKKSVFLSHFFMYLLPYFVKAECLISVDLKACYSNTFNMFCIANAKPIST